MKFTTGLHRARREAGKSAPADYTSLPQREQRVVKRAARRALQHALHGIGETGTPWLAALTHSQKATL